MGYRLSHHLTTCTVQEHRSWVLQPHKEMMTHARTHTHTHTHHTTHTHTHTHAHIHTQLQKLTLLYREGEHPMHYGRNRPQSSSPVDPKQLPALWLRPPLSKSKCGLQIEEKIGCSISDTRRGLKCPVPHPMEKRLVLISDCACLHSQICLLPARHANCLP